MAQRSIFKQVSGLVGWLLISFAAAAAGAIASVNAGDFYRQLVRPGWAPPAWLFSPVWTALYILMGIAAWLVWRSHGFHGAQKALILFLIQLAVNALWSWLFFVWRQGALAFAEALLLWALIACTIVAFRRLHRLAAALLLPYLAWVSFACALSFATWRLNPGMLG
jgi:benzodiazapine receptor